jgi:ABC-type dipeptide/oligopeptide/nickel transport system permease subunit
MSDVSTPSYGHDPGPEDDDQVLDPDPAGAGTGNVGVSGRRRFVRRFRKQTPAKIALAFLLFVVAVSVLAPVLAPYDPEVPDYQALLEAPSGDHLLGTDELGRDTLSRVLYAGRISLLAALQAVGVGLALGVLPGLLAGYFGGKVDTVIMRVADALMSFPPLILAIAIVGVLGPSLTNAMVAVGVIFAPRFLRLVRGSALGVRQETFIEASLSIGTGTPKILTRHVIPNIIAPLIVQIAVSMALAMLSEASLSFLGLGVQPPQASWGSLVARGFREISSSPWLTVFPGLAIAFTVLALNVLGDGLRDSIGREVRRF